MKRNDIIAALRFAGFHADKKSFTRILIENRISTVCAEKAYASGVKLKSEGAKCLCQDCMKAEVRS